FAVRPEWTQLDYATPRHRMPGGDLDGLVEVGAFQYVESSNQILGLSVRAVSQQHLPVSDAHRGRVAARAGTVAHQADPVAIHFLDPVLDVGRAVILARLEIGVGADKHEVLHRVLLVGSSCN